MILADVQAFVKERRQVTVAETARQVGAEPDAVRRMLGLLEAKGRVHRIPLPGSCGTGCCQCSAAGDEVYGWGPAAGLPQISLPCASGR